MKKILALIAMAALSFASAQTILPVANDISMSVFNGTNNTLRYIDTDKTGALQFLMYGQDPTTGTFQLRPQRRVFGPSIVCGNAVNSTCDVVASTMGILAAQITDSSAVGRAVLTASNATAARLAIGAGTSSFDGAYASLSGVPTTFTPAAHTQAWSTITSTPTTLAGYGITDAAAIFNYGAPTSKVVAVNTAYQATNAAKAAVVTISPACTNSTTLLAASACTMQIRQSSTAGLTCSTGTVVSTWSSTIALGLVITQGNSFPVDVKLPIGGYFIACPSAGTFTLSAIEQSAG